MKVEAYQLGYTARMEGQSRDDCPFSTGEDKADWIEGFDDADREFCSGTRSGRMY